MARSRLYRSQFLQVNIRWKALDEIYKIYMLLHRSDINVSAEFRHLVFVFSALGDDRRQSWEERREDHEREDQDDHLRPAQLQRKMRRTDGSWRRLVRLPLRKRGIKTQDNNNYYIKKTCWHLFGTISFSIDHLLNFFHYLRPHETRFWPWRRR